MKSLPTTLVRRAAAKHLLIERHATQMTESICIELEKECLGCIQTGKDGVVSIPSNKLKVGAIYIRPLCLEDRAMICIAMGDVKWTRNVLTFTVTAIKDVEGCLVQCSCPGFLAKNACNHKDIITVSLYLCMRMRSMLVGNASSSFSISNYNSWEFMHIRAKKRIK